MDDQNKGYSVRDNIIWPTLKLPPEMQQWEEKTHFTEGKGEREKTNPGALEKSGIRRNNSAERRKNGSREKSETENISIKTEETNLKRMGLKETVSVSRRTRTDTSFFWLFCVFPAVLLYDELLLRLLSGSRILQNPGCLFLFTISFAFFLTALTGLLRGGLNRTAMMVTLILLQFLFAVECVIHSVFSTYMSPTNLFSSAENVAGHYGSEMVRSIIFSIPKTALFFVPVFVYIFKKETLHIRHIPLRTAGYLMIISLLTGGIGIITASHGKYSAVYGAQFDFNKATETFGLITSTRLSLKYHFFGNKNDTFESEVTKENLTAAEYSAEEAVSTKNEMDLNLAVLEADGSDSVSSLTKYIETLSASDKNEMTGIFKGKNLIMVAAESYCSSFISPELTPTLWRLTHNGFYFSEYYQPEWGGSTTTGELSFLVGLAPRDGDESMINIKDNNNYFTLGNQLQRLNYSSCAFHNGAISYYQRDNTHVNLGYNQFIGNENGLTDLTGAAYCHDEDMISATMDYYLDKQPFSIYYMTISGHAPYEEDSELVAEYYDYVNDIAGEDYEETTKYYICYQMELEAAMTTMVEKLEAAGIADDTVIVLVGDHFPYGLGLGEAWGNYKDYLTDLLKTDHSHSWERDRNGLIIWSGCLENVNKDLQCEISSPVFSLDIVPTLSNLFGVEYDSRLLPGRDVFSDSEPLVFWNNLSWVTERGYYDSSEEKYYPRDGYEYDSEYVKHIQSLVENKILLSRIIMEEDYYSLLFGQDTLTFAGQKIFPMTEAEREAEEDAQSQTDPLYTGVEAYDGEEADGLTFTYEETSGD